MISQNKGRLSTGIHGIIRVFVRTYSQKETTSKKGVESDRLEKTHLCIGEENASIGSVRFMASPHPVFEPELTAEGRPKGGITFHSIEDPWSPSSAARRPYQAIAEDR